MVSYTETNVKTYLAHRLRPGLILPSEDIMLDPVEDVNVSRAVYNISVWPVNNNFGKLVNWKTGRGVGRMQLDIISGDALGSVYAPLGFAKDRILFLDLEDRAYGFFRKINDKIQTDSNKGIIANANLLEFLDGIHKGDYDEIVKFLDRFEVAGLIV